MEDTTKLYDIIANKYKMRIFSKNQGICQHSSHRKMLLKEMNGWTHQERNWEMRGRACRLTDTREVARS